MPFDGTNLGAVTRVLIEGRRRVAESWCQGTWRGWSVSGGHCAVFAISRQNAGETTPVALAALARAVYGSNDPQGIVPWNDAPGRTKEEVLAAYDRAIAAAMERR